MLFLLEKQTIGCCYVIISPLYRERNVVLNNYVCVQRILLVGCNKFISQMWHKIVHTPTMASIYSVLAFSLPDVSQAPILACTSLDLGLAPTSVTSPLISGTVLPWQYASSSMHSISISFNCGDGRRTQLQIFASISKICYVQCSHQPQSSSLLVHCSLP